MSPFDLENVHSLMKLKIIIKCYKQEQQVNFHNFVLYFDKINPYPARTESDQFLPSISIEPSQTARMLADQLQDLILISLKMVIDSSRNGWWIVPLKKFSKLRVTTSIIKKINPEIYLNISETRTDIH